jgi:hypothetical protein
MNKTVVASLLVASALSLAGCNQNKPANTSTTNNSTASAPAGNSGAAATASNSAAPTGTGGGADATNQNFTIRNNTGQTINELYVSAVSSDDWEEDILGRDTLANGDTAQIAFARAESQCKWDVRVVFENEQALEERDVDLCQTAAVEIAP